MKRNDIILEAIYQCRENGVNYMGRALDVRPDGDGSTAVLVRVMATPDEYTSDPTWGYPRQATGEIDGASPGGTRLVTSSQVVALYMGGPPT